MENVVENDEIDHSFVLDIYLHLWYTELEKIFIKKVRSLIFATFS